MTRKEQLLKVVEKLRNKKSKEKVYGISMDEFLDILEDDIVNNFSKEMEEIVKIN